jgi:hypothetical protein
MNKYASMIKWLRSARSHKFVRSQAPYFEFLTEVAEHRQSLLQVVAYKWHTKQVVGRALIVGARSFSRTVVQSLAE